MVSGPMNSRNRPTRNISPFLTNRATCWPDPPPLDLKVRKDSNDYNSTPLGNMQSLKNWPKQWLRNLLSNNITCICSINMLQNWLGATLTLEYIGQHGDYRSVSFMRNPNRGHLSVNTKNVSYSAVYTYGSRISWLIRFEMQYTAKTA